MRAESSARRPGHVHLLREDLLRPASIEAFRQGRQQDPALARHDDPASVLAALEGRSADGWPEREALTRALIARAQEESHEVWSTLILVAYQPMLRRLAHGAAKSRGGASDLRQTLVLCFLEAVQGLPLARFPDRTCLRLRLETQRRLLAELRRQHCGTLSLTPQPIDCLERHKIVPAQLYAESPMARVEDEQLLAEALRDWRLPASQAGARGVRLKTWLLNAYPDISPAEQRRLYERDKRRRTRARQRLRLVISQGPFTDRAGDSPLVGGGPTDQLSGVKS